MPMARRMERVRGAAAASTDSGSRAGPSSPSQISSSPMCSACSTHSTSCGAGAAGKIQTPDFGKGTAACEDYTAMPWIRTVPWNDATGTLKAAYDWQAKRLGEPTEYTQLGSLYPDLVQLRLQLY